MSVFRRCILSVLPFLVMFFSGCGGFKGVVTPTLSSISPASVAAGSAAFTLTATGTNFTSGTQILWDGVAQPTTVVSNTQLTASITAAQIAVAGDGQYPRDESGYYHVRRVELDNYRRKRTWRRERYAANANFNQSR